MERVCRSGVKLLPEDPVWRYNLACSLAYLPDRRDAALDPNPGSGPYNDPDPSGDLPSSPLSPPTAPRGFEWG